jgi:DNA-binding NtrC family response regulator
VTGAGDRLALFDAMGRLFVLASRSAPVVVLPDLEVADRSSLELVRYLLSRLGTPDQTAGGLVVATLRDDVPLSPGLRELLEQVSVRTVSLAGLDLEGIRSFLARPEVARRLLDSTGGNPDALGELVERPVGAVDFFLKRVEALQGLDRAVLELLAYAPTAVSVPVIARALEVDASAVARALDLLAARHLVVARVVDARANWRFARAQDKQVLAAHLSRAQDHALRGSLGRALAEAGELGAACELLMPVAPAEGARIGLEAAMELLERGALEDGCALLAAGHAWLPRDLRARSAAAWGRAALSLGALRQGARRQLEAARLGDGNRGASLRAAAQALVKLGRLGRAEVVLGRLERLPGQARSAALVRAQALLAHDRLDDAVDVCGQLAAGESDGSSAEARLVWGKALLVRGLGGEARRVFEQARVEAFELGLPALAAQAQLNEGVAAWRQGERAHAIACWEACAQLEDRRCRAHALANLGSAWAEDGQFEPALSALARALEAFSRFGSARESALAASNLARLLHLLGDFERATELGQHARERGAALGEPYLEASANLTLGAIASDQRRLADALTLLEAARVGFEQLGNQGFAALAAGLKARTHLQAGARAQAEVELGRGCVQVGARVFDAAALEVELTRGELCLTSGDLLGATRCATRAREVLLARPTLDGPVRTHALMAKLRLAAGDGGGAQAEFQRAARLIDELAHRVPVARRRAFLAAPGRAEVLAALEPSLPIPSPLQPAHLPEEVSRQHGLVGRSALLQKVLRQLEPVGRSNATVLIRGESGTGKELLAEALHALSGRRHLPLVKVNCAAMVEDLLLSELFGHEKGAFTGAVRERKGRFELADGSSIFLDEIGDLSPKAQVSLLRVLQAREFERVGGSRTLKVDVRVICATNRDLEVLMAQGRFRADLYYRLKGVMLELPPLRARLEDLPLLAQAFLDRLTAERGDPVRRLTDASLQLLARHDWPGNVRELENVVSTAAIFAEGPDLAPEAFAHVGELAALVKVENGAEAPALGGVAAVPEAPEAATARAQPADPVDWFALARARSLSLKDLRTEVELQCIRSALVEARGNISKAARLLKMKRSRLSQMVNADAALKELAHGE